MMMHHDEQPLISRGPKPYGLLNQLKLLRKAGAISMQVLMLVPATGSKLFVGTYTSGMAYDSVGGRKVVEHMLGGNYVVASNHDKPWRKQLNILIAYLYFYNPWQLFVALVRGRSKPYFTEALWQVVGMYGLAQTARHTVGWALPALLQDQAQERAPDEHCPHACTDRSPCRARLARHAAQLSARRCRPV